MQLREVDQRRVAAIKGQTTRMQAQVDALEITDDASMAIASDLRSKIKQYERAMAKEKKDWLDPINLLRNKVFAVFKPFESQVNTALKAVDSKIIDYQNHKEAEAQKEAERLQKRVERGTLKPETALRKMGEVDTPDTMVETDNGKTVFQERRDIEVDIDKLPKEYMIPDYVKIRRAALQENRTIEGVTIVTKKVIASR